MADSKLKVEINGEAGGFFNVLGQVGKSIDGFTTHVTGRFSGVADVIASVQKPLLGIASLMGGGALFKGSIDGAVDFGKETGKIQRIMGGTRQEAAALSVAIGDIYGDADTFLGGIQKLTKTLNANEGSLKSMGVATRDASGNLLPMGQIVQNVNQALLQYREGVDRDAASQKLLGRSWADWLLYLKLTPQVIEDARKKTEELGMTMGPEAQDRVAKYRAAMNDAEDAVQALKMRIGLDVMPTLSDLANWFSTQAPGAIGVSMDLLRGAGDLLGNTAIQAGLLAGVLNWTLGPAILRTITFTTSWFALIRTQGLFTGLLVGLDLLRVKLLTVIGPWMIALGAIVAVGYGLSAWAQSYSRDGAKQAEAMRDQAQAATQTAREFGTLAGQAEVLEDQVKKTKDGTQMHEAAKRQLNATVAKALEMYPDLISYLHKENGAYVDVTESMARYRKSRLKQIEMEIEDSKRRAVEARDDHQKAMDGGWSGIVGYALVYKGIADNALREAQANESSTKELEKQRSILKGQEEAAAGGDKRFQSGGGDSESALQRLKADLEKRRYLYEKEAFERGQLQEYSKQQEADYLQQALRTFQGNAKERAQLEKMLFEAKRAVMKETSDAEMEGLKSSMEAQKNNGAIRESIALQTFEKESKLHGQGSQEAAKAYGDLLKVRREIAEEEKAILEIQIEVERDHASAMLALEESSIRSQRQLGEIGAQKELDALRALEQAKYDLEWDALQKQLALTKEGTQEKEKLFARLAKLKDDHTSKTQGFASEQRGLDQQNTMKGGLKSYVSESKRDLTQWGTMAKGIMQGVENSFSAGIKGILSGNMKLGQGLKAIWSGIADTIISALAQIAAKYLTAAIANAIFGEATAGVAQTQAGAAQVAAAAGYFEAYSAIPYVGVALAMGSIAVMEGVMAGMQAKAVVGAAEGGWFDRPTLTMIGEGRRPELVVPDTSFKDFARNLSANILAQERQAQGYSIQASGYAMAAQQQGGRNVAGGRPYMGGGGDSHNYAGATIVAVNSRQWEDIVAKGQRGYEARRS